MVPELSPRGASLPPLAASGLPKRAGAGFKTGHADAILADREPVGFLEVHAENYMGKGGHPHRILSRMREDFALSVHGVGLSIGAENGLDSTHLDRLAEVIARYQPGMVSEHLAWSTHDSHYYNDLLPLPYSQATLARVIEHVDRVQNRLGRRILMENPSTYITFVQSTMSETDFIEELAEQSGCGLLFDVNNLYVSAINHGLKPERMLADFPLHLVEEIHLAGHAETEDDEGRPLLIDAHDRPVADPVWDLYRTTIARTGPLPTLIEWDNDVPDWPVLKREALIADAIMLQNGERHLMGRRHG